MRDHAVFGLALAAVVISGACGGRDDLDGTRRAPEGLPQRAPAFALAAAPGEQVAYDLVDNRPLAAVHAGGALVVECGGSGFATYTEGTYRSSWHLDAQDGGRRVALVDGLAGELYLPIDRAEGGVSRAPDGSVRIALWARAAAEHQLVSVFLNEHKLGDVSMPTTAWQWYELRAPASAVVDGENKLRFYFKHAGEIGGVRTAAALGQIRVGGAASRGQPGAPAGVGDVELAAGRLAALTAPAGSRLSYYVLVPDDAPALVFAAARAGGGPAALRVRVATDTGAGETAWTGEAGPDWTAARVPLDAWAGRAVRIDLVADGDAHWGRPLVVARGQAAGDVDAQPVDHVIVWTVSSLRADAVGAGRTPHIDAFLAEAAQFTGLYAASSSPGPAHEALLTGRHPGGEGGAPTLGGRYRAAGYAASLVSGNGYVNDDVGLADGFGNYHNPMRRRQPFGAPVLWQLARKVLVARKDNRSFAYVATVEPHLPYTPSAESLAAEWTQPAPPRVAPARTALVADDVAAGRLRLTGDERGYVTALYRAAVRDADDAFGAMLAELTELGLADRTAVVLVGDHGEALFDRGDAFGHGSALRDEQLRTPLAIRAPGLAPARIDAPVAAVDVYATVLDLAGIGLNPEAQGRSLLPLARGVGDVAPRAVFAVLPGRERALRLGPWKLIVPRVGAHELYDLAADPREQTNAMTTNPIAARCLRSVFGLGVAYEAAWRQRRWGAPHRLTPAFAADHAM